MVMVAPLPLSRKRTLDVVTTLPQYIHVLVLHDLLPLESMHMYTQTLLHPHIHNVPF